MTTPHPPRLPDPAAAGDWPDLTAALRELHLDCGRPTYETLSVRSGLPKSAISYLIGKNPVRRPSEATVLRFVQACLVYRGHSADVVAGELARWRAAWTALDRGTAAELTAPASAAAVPPVDDETLTPTPPPARTVRRPVRALAVAAAVLGVGVIGWAGGHQAKPAVGGSPPPTTTPVPARAAPSTAAATTSPAGTPSPSASPSPCEIERTHYSDARLDRDWTRFAYCPNRPALVYVWPRRDAEPIARLQTRNSWFACWVSGPADTGTGEQPWFYTQGDTTESRPELDSWGFVPGSVLLGVSSPPKGLAKCDFVRR